MVSKRQPIKKRKSLYASKIQAVIFENKHYTTTQARAWLKKARLHPIKKVDKKGKHLRYRIQSPTKFRSFATKKTGKHLSFIIGFPK